MGQFWNTVKLGKCTRRSASLVMRLAIARICKRHFLSLSLFLFHSQRHEHTGCTSSQELPHAMEIGLSVGIPFTPLSCLPVQRFALDAALERSRCMSQVRQRQQIVDWHSIIIPRAMLLWAVDAAIHRGESGAGWVTCVSGLKASVSTEVVRFMSVFKGEVAVGSRGPVDAS